MNSKRRVVSVLQSTTGLLISAVFLIPILIIISTSFSQEAIVASEGYGILPKGVSLSAYKYIFIQSRSLLNAYALTIGVTVIGTLCSMFCTLTFAYTLARKDFVLSKALNYYVFFTMLFSGGTVPTYIMMVQGLHLKNHLFALILPLMLSAFNLILMRNFFASIPISLIESAKMDGAKEFRILFQVVIPISKPGIATVSLLYILTYWNDWYQALLYIDSPQLQPLQMLLQRMMSVAEVMKTNTSGMLSAMQVPAETARMAMCVMAIGPIILIFPFVQKFLVKGLTMGSVKG